MCEQTKKEFSKEPKRPRTADRRRNSSTEGTPPCEILDVRYAGPDSHVLQALDIHLPPGHAPGKTYPVLLTVHGGNWDVQWGDKTDFDGMTEFITGRGMIHVSMNYRVNTNRPGAPVFTVSDMLDDITAALNYLKNACGDIVMASEAGLMGFSSGGVLSLLYAFQRTNDAIPIRFVVPIAAPVDLLTHWNSFRPGTPLYDYFKVIYQNLTGLKSDDPAFPEALRHISPLRIITPSVPPKGLYTLLAYGLLDPDDTVYPKDPEAFGPGPEGGDGIVSVWNAAALYHALRNCPRRWMMSAPPNSRHKHVLADLILHKSEEFDNALSDAIALVTKPDGRCGDQVS